MSEVENEIRNAPRPHSPVQTAVACSGRSSSQDCCASAAALATPTLPATSAPSSGTLLKLRSGQPCGHSRKAPRCTAAWPLRARHSNHDKSMQVYEDRAENAETNSRILRDFLIHVNSDEEVPRAEESV